MQVPLFRFTLAPHHRRLIAAIDRVVASGRFILGPEVESFEREFADYVGARHCVGVANGTEALMLSLRALGVGPGDDVVVPSFTFYASAEAVAAIGARPVFCDIDPTTFCLTPETVRSALTAHTRAIVAVHLFGYPAPVEELAEFGVPIVEDAAQATGGSGAGGRVGTLGTIAAFSFFPSKNLPCLGDGGAVTTDDPELADRVRMLRHHGSRDKTTFELVGFNSRLDALQAAVLRELLPQLDGWNAARRSAAARYRDLGLDRQVTVPSEPPAGEHVYHLYVVRHPRRDVLAEALREQGIEARSYYAQPIHRQPAMRSYAPNVALPGTEEAARSNLALPMGPELTAAESEHVVAAIERALAATTP
ncbi:DegT/DnrJ/EryC1/StrS family aminotransferase [Thermoleophilum album]|uniref:DegT/DnrJ/EryC1/StrS family aminotransferase n=1 Tax=Thermoleophilum album TaxID=29539 RepID=UPI00237CAB42|nr:DegT/DnrJ/EryC1/StrS family aminotransferase [Thermoleophilum album]WDT93711.1 DegT/DnrJ/EryC1/StrS family aminotransferase [Thermoleophilum album]